MFHFPEFQLLALNNKMFAGCKETAGECWEKLKEREVLVRSGFENRRSQIFVKRGTLRNFAIFARKHTA